jgi:glycerate kinase
MRVLLAPGDYPGALTAAQAAEAMAQGWTQGAPHDHVAVLPLADGGSGLVDVLSRALEGEQVVVTIGDPLGRPVPATILRVPGGPDGTGATAYLDGAAAVGGHLVDAADHDAGFTSSHGLGELVRLALALDVTRIVIGLGTGVAFDGGAGLLAALGAGPVEDLARGGLALADLTALDAERLESARAALGGVELVLVTDEDLPLLGFHGVHAVRAGSGADGSAVTPTARGQALEAAVGHFAHLATRAHGRTDLLSGKPRRVDQEPGAGAGGGAGHGLLLLARAGCRALARSPTSSAWGLPSRRTTSSSRVSAASTGRPLAAASCPSSPSWPAPSRCPRSSWRPSPWSGVASPWRSA